MLAFATSSPIAITGSITVTANEDLATATSSYAIVVTRANAEPVPGAVTLAADRRSMTWTPTDAMAYSTALTVSAAAQDPSGNRGAITQGFSTVDGPAPVSWWPPKEIALEGLKIVHPFQLSSDCTSWTTVCWQEAVRAGLVQFVETPALASGRRVVFAYYITPAGLYATLPMYRDDGAPVSGDIGSGVADEIDWVIGTATGALVHDKPANSCSAYGYNGTAWVATGAACPVDNTPPTLAFASSSPIAITGSITVTADEPLMQAEVTVMRGDIIQVTGTAAFAADHRSFTWTPTQPMPYFTELWVVTDAWDQSGNRSNAIQRTYHTVDSPDASPWWPPAQVAANGVKVSGANALPAGCAGWPDNCWKDAVRNGTVKFFQGGGSIQSEGRPVVHAFFRRLSPADGVTPEWCLMPEWIEDGWKPSPMPAVATTQLSCRSQAIDWVMGTFDGYLLPDAGGATCTNYTLSGASATPTPAACPP